MKPNIFATIIDQNQSFIIGLWWENGSCKLGSSLVERIESWTPIGWLICTVPRLSTFWWITDRLCGRRGGGLPAIIAKKSLVCTQLVITWTCLQGLIQPGLTYTLSFFQNKFRRLYSTKTSIHNSLHRFRRLYSTRTSIHSFIFVFTAYIVACRVPNYDLLEWPKSDTTRHVVYTLFLRAFLSLYLSLTSFFGKQ